MSEPKQGRNVCDCGIDCGPEINDFNRLHLDAAFAAMRKEGQGLSLDQEMMIRRALILL